MNRRLPVKYIKCKSMYVHYEKNSSSTFAAINTFFVLNTDAICILFLMNTTSEVDNCLYVFIHDFKSLSICI